MGVGWGGQDGRADCVAFNCWPSKGFHRLAFEIKRSRRDFMREVDKPAKRKWLEENFHQTYFVLSADVKVKDDEFPAGWGVLVANKKGSGLRRVKAAMHREVQPMPEDLALSAIRSMADKLSKEQHRSYFLDGEHLTKDDLRDVVSGMVDGIRENADRVVKEAYEQQRALEEEREKLAAPLGVLAQAVLGNWEGRKAVSVPYDGKSKVRTITVEQVEQWLGAARLLRTHNVNRELVRARDALVRLVDAAGLEDETE